LERGAIASPPVKEENSAADLHCKWRVEKSKINARAGRRGMLPRTRVPDVGETASGAPVRPDGGEVLGVRRRQRGGRRRAEMRREVEVWGQG